MPTFEIISNTTPMSTESFLALQAIVQNRTISFGARGILIWCVCHDVRIFSTESLLPLTNEPLVNILVAVDELAHAGFIKQAAQQ